jgi:redox-sensitive bicupin YhaK (pirin superfamily)
MLTVRPAAERGHADHGWLSTWHSFSFADYHDDAHMGFRSLRVINDDLIAPGMGFGTHGHRDMEIVTWVLDGALSHKDSLGNGSTLRPGDAQRMSAGTGIRHSEFNGSADAPVRLLQIWIEPERAGLPPLWQEKHFPRADREHRLRAIVARDGRDGSLPIAADVAIFAGLLATGDRVGHALAGGRHAWLQVANGSLTVNGRAVGVGDGVAISGERALELVASADSEVLLFDLA